MTNIMTTVTLLILRRVFKWRSETYSEVRFLWLRSALDSQNYHNDVFIYLFVCLYLLLKF